MKEKEFMEKFKGREFWKTLNLFAFFAIYTVFFVSVIFFIDVLWIIGLISMFLMMLYVTIQQFYYRKMERKNAGRRVLSGWIELNESVGQEWEVPIEKVSEQNKTSSVEREEIKKYLTRYKEEFDKPKISGGFKEYLLPDIKDKKEDDENAQ